MHKFNSKKETKSIGQRPVEQDELTEKKLFTDVRISAGFGIGILYGNKYSSLNVQSLLSKDFTISAGLDYYFIKNKEERMLENFISPSLVVLYNLGDDIEGNELLFGGGISYSEVNKFKPLITFRGNLYLRNHFYLGLEVKQPFQDPVVGSPGSLNIFLSPYIGINLLYKLIN